MNATSPSTPSEAEIFVLVLRTRLAEPIQGFRNPPESMRLHLEALEKKPIALPTQSQAVDETGASDDSTESDR